jgi:cobalt/nickel transport system permease protein
LHLTVQDPYIDKLSFLQKIPALYKLLSALILIITIVTLPRSIRPAYGIIAVIQLIIFIISRLPLRVILKRLLLFEPFVLMAAMLSIIQPNGKTIFLSLILKGTMSLFTMVMLVASTRFFDILDALRRLHIPRILVTNISLMYRYLFILLSETERMVRARSSRTFIRKRLLVWRSNADLIGHLFVRTSKRAERIYTAMCARGWKS